MFIYESHLGGLFATRMALTDTYCDECGDSDTYVGYANTRAQAKAVLKGYGEASFYSKRYIKDFIEENWEK